MYIVCHKKELAISIYSQLIKDPNHCVLVGTMILKDDKMGPQMMFFVVLDEKRKKLQLPSTVYIC